MATATATVIGAGVDIIMDGVEVTAIIITTDSKLRIFKRPPQLAASLYRAGGVTVARPEREPLAPLPVPYGANRQK